MVKRVTGSEDVKYDGKGDSVPESLGSCDTVVNQGVCHRRQCSGESCVSKSFRTSEQREYVFKLVNPVGVETTPYGGPLDK